MRPIARGLVLAPPGPLRSALLPHELLAVQLEGVANSGRPLTQSIEVLGAASMTRGWSRSRRRSRHRRLRRLRSLRRPCWAPWRLAPVRPRWPDLPARLESIGKRFVHVSRIVLLRVILIHLVQGASEQRFERGAGNDDVTGVADPLVHLREQFGTRFADRQHDLVTVVGDRLCSSSSAKACEIRRAAMSSTSTSSAVAYGSCHCSASSWAMSSSVANPFRITISPSRSPVCCPSSSAFLTSSSDATPACMRRVPSDARMPLSSVNRPPDLSADCACAYGETFWFIWKRLPGS